MRMIPAAAVAALALVLTGCGDKDDAADEPKVVEIDMDDVLLNQTDLADQFVESEDDDDDDEPDLGCFGDADGLGEDAEEKEEQGYEIPGETGFPVIELTVSRYESAKALEEKFDDVVASLEDCDGFEVEEDDYSMEMEVETDDEVTIEDVDRQVEIDVEGFMTAGGQQIPMVVVMRGVIVDGYFTGAMFSDLGDYSQANPQAVVDVLIEAQAERLVAAVEGEDLPEREDLKLVDAYVS